jgi:hypothetical protein
MAYATSQPAGGLPVYFLSTIESTDSLVALKKLVGLRTSGAPSKSLPDSIAFAEGTRDSPAPEKRFVGIARWWNQYNFQTVSALKGFANARVPVHADDRAVANSL